MTVHLYTGLPIAVSADTTIRFVAVAADGTISDLQEAVFDFPPQLAFSAQPSPVSGSTITYGTYDPGADDAVSTADATVTATSAALLREAAVALVNVGVTAESAQTLIEKVLATSQVTTSVATTMQLVDSLTAQIQAFPTVSDILELTATGKPPFIFTMQPVVSTVSGNGGVFAYGTADTGADDVSSEGSAAVSIADVVAQVESALITIAAVPTVADLMTQVDNVTSTVQAETAAIDGSLKIVSENLLSAASSLTSVNDLQLMVDNVVILAESGVSLGEIAAYTDRMVASVGVQAMVDDVLRGSFINSYLFYHTCSPRYFADIASARAFNDICSPRGRV